MVKVVKNIDLCYNVINLIKGEYLWKVKKQIFGELY